LSGVVLLQRPSPNFNERPAGVTISAVVLHADSAPKVASSIQWCRTPKHKLPKPNNGPVSYHDIIGRIGDVYHLVDYDKRAWSNGKSVFKGVSDVNDYAISISFGNRQDGKEPFTEAQYQTGAALVRELMLRYPAITKDRITTHAKISPGRKYDPEIQGPFDLKYFLSLIPE
jgi:N-acetyl-anhydromuramyl-L-alanine amidase AmpD